MLHKKMKKFFILLSFLFCGCSCVLSQIPPQYIYTPANNCQALLPDYTGILKISDNCQIGSVFQYPASGYILNNQNMTANVIIRATDVSGNFKEVRFTVTLLDTIKPQITLDTTLFVYNVLKFTQLYDLADSYTQMALNPDSSYQKEWLFVASRKDSLGFRERYITYKPDSLVWHQ